MKFVFSNGSFIKICGCNNNQFNNLRGNKSDTFIIDEARDVDDLNTVIKDIALPQLLSSSYTNKRILIASTPPTSPDHPFKKHAEKAKARGAYSYYTIHDGWYTPEELIPFIEESGGIESTTWKREYLAEFVTDETLQIIPEWDSKQFIQDVPKDDYFQFWRICEGLDMGYRDFTAWIMGYYNFNEAKLIIEYEIALRENDFTTEALAKDIHKTEEEYKQNSNRHRRIADCNNLNMLADLTRLYKLPFQPVNKKHGKTWMVNQLRQLVKSGRLIIHPRCKMLIASLEFGIWKKGLEEFDRSEELGHYDFIDALVYLVAVLLPTVEHLNPVPPLYKVNVSTTMFPNGIPENVVENQNEAIKKMFPPLKF